MSSQPARLEAAHGREPPLPRPAWQLLSIIVACTAVFAAVSIDITHNGPLDRFDQHVARWAVARSYDIHTWSWRLTHLGDAGFLTTLILFAVAFLLWQRRRLDVILLCAGASATALTTTLLKLAFHRSRPPFVDQVNQLRSFSFPSGHASGAFAVYVLLALLLTDGLARRWRAAAVAGGLTVGSLVGLTRVLIPVHYLTDVIAGSAIGLAAAVTTWLVRETVQSRR